MISPSNFSSTDAFERVVVIEQVFGVGVLRLVRGGVQQGHVHLERRVAQQTQQLRFGGDLGRHEVQDRHPQRADVLAFGALLAHHEDVLSFENGAGGQRIGNSDGHRKNL